MTVAGAGGVGGVGNGIGLYGKGVWSPSLKATPLTMPQATRHFTGACYSTAGSPSSANTAVPKVVTSAILPSRTRSTSILNGV